MTSARDENNELNRLASINKDACEFYDSAQEETQSAQMKQTFRKLGDLHREVVTNLEACIRKNGGKVEGDETLIGKTAQFWAELMAKVSNDVDETLVKHLEQAEDRCLHSMEKALKDGDMSAQTKISLQNDMQTLRKTHDYMKALKDAMKAA